MRTTRMKGHALRSYWELKNLFGPQDILVVGGGLVGLCSAIYCKRLRPNVKITIIDADPLPQGASTRNAGFLCFGSPSELLANIKEYGEAEVLNLINRRIEGAARLRELVGDENLDFRASGGFEVFRASDHASYQDCCALLEDWKSRGLLDSALTGKFVWQDRRTPKVLGSFAYSIALAAEGLLDPAKMILSLQGLADRLNVRRLQGVKCTSYQEGEKGIHVSTDVGILSTERLLIATNGFAAELVPDSGIRAFRNQVIVTEPTQLKLPGAIHYQEGYYYFRNVADRILLGGGRCKDLEREDTAEFGLTDTIQGVLEDFLQELLDASEVSLGIDFRWSGILGQHPSAVPEVKKLSERAVIASGFNGMGIALGASVAADASKLLAS